VEAFTGVVGLITVARLTTEANNQPSLHFAVKPKIGSRHASRPGSGGGGGRWKAS